MINLTELHNFYLTTPNRLSLDRFLITYMKKKIVKQLKCDTVAVTMKRNDVRYICMNVLFKYFSLLLFTNIETKEQMKNIRATHIKLFLQIVFRK